MRLLHLLPLTLVVACTGDETLTQYGGAGTWQLTELDGAPFAATATLDLSEPGTVSGAAPCNRFSGPQTAPYPWFATGPLMTTRRACADLSEEARFLDALAAMSIAEVAGNTLILTNDTGRTMVFTRIGPGG